jgi:predicted RNA-binding protein (virulence factor B family)
MKIGEEVEVFIYHDSEDRLIATTQKPLAKLDEFGFFEVVDVTHFGAFVSWGLAKDLLVPKRFQKEPFKIGQKQFLRVVYDEKTHRLVATQKFSKYLNYEPKGYTINKKVKALIIKETDLGYKCIVDDMYEGLLFKNEVFETLTIGEIKKAFIKKRRPDGKLDLSLKKVGAKASKDSQAKVLELLKEHNGVLPYNYKSSPQEIKEFFGLSKKEFKRVLTKLQEAKKIEITDKGIKKSALL